MGHSSSRVRCLRLKSDKRAERRAVLCSCVACSYVETCYVKLHKETVYCHKCKTQHVIDKSGASWVATELAAEEIGGITNGFNGII